MTPSDLVMVDKQHEPVLIVTINRANVKNAVDGPTAKQLHAAFVQFAQDEKFSVAILRGAGSTFCAGADLTAAFENLSDVRGGDTGQRAAESRANALSSDMDAPGPMGPTRMALPKPVIACVEGYALAGGLELAAWCDMRVASASAQIGLPCRTRGVPLIDGGTVRLPALIGSSRATDLILTGRIVSAHEAFEMGLVNRIVTDTGSDAVLEVCIELAKLIASKPALCMRHDRLSMMGVVETADEETTRAYDGARCPYAVQGEMRTAMANEFQHGLISLTDLGKGLEEFIRRPRRKENRL